MCSTKFSYILSLHITPMGLPVVMTMPSLTIQVSGSVLMLVQPDRSMPLNIGTHSGRDWANATSGTRAQQPAKRKVRMAGHTILAQDHRNTGAQEHRSTGAQEHRKQEAGSRN